MTTDRRSFITGAAAAGATTTAAAATTKHAGGAPLGSKHSQSTRLTRRKQAEIIASGDSPLDVLMEDMRWWKRQRDRLHGKIVAAVPGFNVERDSFFEIRPAENDETTRHYLDQYMTARKETRAAALDAAPFVHARMASLKPDQGGDASLQDLAKLTDAELDQLEGISRKIAGAYGNEPSDEPA
jgi:hypothetical protein